MEVKLPFQDIMSGRPTQGRTNRLIGKLKLQKNLFNLLDYARYQTSYTGQTGMDEIGNCGACLYRDCKAIL